MNLFLSTALAEEAAATTEQTSWFYNAFHKLGEISPVIWGILAALALLGIVFGYVSHSKTKWTVRMLSNAALSIALAFILSFIRLYKMPQGGSITLASMLPIFLFSYAYGTAPGMLVGLCYGFLQWMQDGFYMVHPVEGVVDYLLAFAVLGLAGLGRKLPEKYSLPVGCVIGAVCRAFCAILSGYIFFGSYAPEGQAPIVYSMIYNGLYLIPETAICVVLACVPQIRQTAKLLSVKQ